MRYLNIKTSYGVETVDELNPSDFGIFKDFRVELSRLVSEYRMAGMNVYVSQRPCKDWNK